MSLVHRVAEQVECECENPCWCGDHPHFDGVAGHKAGSDKHGDGDEAVGLHVFLQLFGGVLIEDYGVVGLVLDCLSYDVSDSCICNATIETDGIVEEEFVIVVSYPCPWTTSSSLRPCRRSMWALP